MTIRVIYKDKTIGKVNESRLNALIKSGRIAAFCRSNDEWVRVEHTSSEHGDDFNEQEKDGA